MNMRIQEFTGVYMGVHENTGFTKAYSFYMGIHENKEFTGVHMGEHENTGVYRGIHGCT